MGDAMARKMMSALRVDLPGSTGLGVQLPPLPPPPLPPLATALSLEGVHCCLAVSEPY